MGWRESCIERLPEHLDANGDLPPPWARFPEYERYTIGWRMGAGEDWLGLWHVFLEELGPEPEARLSYLKRHPPAPYSWADTVQRVLQPDDDDVLGLDLEPSELAELEARGLIASDIAYSTWLSQQTGVHWPWEDSKTPESAARYRTRDLWFWSRQVSSLRATPTWTSPRVPLAWTACRSALSAGEPPQVDTSSGLLTLAQFLCAGSVRPPWALGLRVADFCDSFEDDMGYVDAFRLWGMSAFDDSKQLASYLEHNAIPPDWEPWIAEQLAVP